MLSPTWYSFPAGHICSHPSITRQLFSGSKSGVIFRPLIIGIAFICSWNIGYAWADSIESALMPGQVIQGHAKWEEDCAKCHKRFDKAAQTRLCQDCHKDIREDIDRKQRLHGRVKEQRDCKDCHTDHKGRRENIAPINESTFNHSSTNFALNGSHADSKKADCKACHKPKVRYRDAPSDCLACHKKDDKHKGNFGEKCVACHTENNWKEIVFNHDRDTKYSLLDKHKSAKCESCHTGHLYKNKLKADCFSCHKKVDYHKGVFGPKCETCHSEKNWKTSPFNHDKDTKYPLLDKHRTTKCENCHKAPVAREKTPTVCYACHKKDDRHEGALGRACEACHTENDWKYTPAFDHDKTKFPLRGKHIDTKCKDCHPDQRYKPTPIDCYSCHKKDETHKGRFGERCESCHIDQRWKEIVFDHDRQTKYPLRDKHRGLTCENCHKGHLYLDKDKTPMVCYACHRREDIHNGVFGEGCDTCHNEKGWKLSSFDHDRDTKYILIGRHVEVKCEDCHTMPSAKGKTPTTCVACHKKDDSHKGQYGDRCESCHIAKSWKHSMFDHDRDTKYPLRGKHIVTACKSCHTGHLYNDKLKTDCYPCHKKDDKHKGQEGVKCEACHSEERWRGVVFDHEASAFPLRGAHDITPCRKCHQTLTFKDTPSACIACHEKEDIHKRRLGTECQTCHNARDWKLWKFDHNTHTSFILDGAHAPLDCYACHTKPMGKKVAVSSACAGCHRKDDKHEGGFGPQCDRCHVTVLWKTIKAGGGAFRDR